MTGRTIVQLVWREGEIEHWIRFGRIAEDTTQSRSRRTVGFDSGAVFAFVRWSANAYGTALSRIDILRAPCSGEPHSTVPHVAPGGDSLLRISGWPKVERVLEIIDAVEALGVDPADAAPDYWRHVHSRLTAGLAPRLYAPAQHRAWILRRACPPPPRGLCAGEPA